jgi:two-component system response regulator
MSEQGVDILLADDSTDDIELISKALGIENKTWNIVTVRDGVEAVEFVFGDDDDPGHALMHRPRLVVLDLKMPRMNGFQVLQRIKSDPRTHDIPVVVLTSSPDRKDMAESTRLGASDYKIKPVTFDFYRKMVQDIAHRWLEGSPSTQ